jgi:hypothetical protein
LPDPTIAAVALVTVSSLLLGYSKAG